MASADIKGKLRVWSYDNEEHFCKLDFLGMTGPIRGISWDGESKRICIVGQTSATSISNGKDAGSCTRIFGWDTGVSGGALVSCGSTSIIRTFFQKDILKMNI